MTVLKSSSNYTTVGLLDQSLNTLTNEYYKNQHTQFCVTLYVAAAADFYLVVEISLIKMKPMLKTADNYNLKLLTNELINQTQIWQCFVYFFIP